MWQWLVNLFVRTEDRLFGAQRSSQWPRVRSEYLKKYPICEICGTKKDLNVHHKIPVHVNQSQELNPDNLITLCEGNGCHLRFGHLYNFRSFNSDIKTDAILWNKKIRNRP